MDIKKALIVILALGAAAALRAQPGPDCHWMLGFAPNAGGPLFGTSAMDFCGPELEIYPLGSPLSFHLTNASISSEAGELLFYTNGIAVVNALHQIMPNGAGLNPSDHGLEEAGMALPQGALILPFPGRPGEYCIIYADYFLDFSSFPPFRATPLYYTRVDMALDEGKGDLAEKNVALSADTLEHGKIAAVRHANGRDWWICVPRYGDRSILRFLLTPEGIEALGPTPPGTLSQVGYGNAAFSPDGAYYASHSTVDDTYIDLLAFDRCSGEFTAIGPPLDPESFDFGGIAFSPNSRFLYCTAWDRLLQFDLAASPVSSSMTVVAEYDGYVEQNPGQSPAGTYFFMPALGPDGRIFIIPYHSSLFMHVIEQPDLAGPDCQAVQRGIELPALNISLPNFPNYRLGALEDSPCDSIMTSIVERVAGWSVRLWPNPAQGHCMVSLEQAEAAGAPPQQSLSLQLFDSLGRLLRQEAWPAGAPEWRLSLAGLPPGVYYASIRAEGQAVAVERLVVVR